MVRCKYITSVIEQKRGEQKKKEERKTEGKAGGGIAGGEKEGEQEGLEKKHKEDTTMGDSSTDPVELRASVVSINIPCKI